ncbi:MAG: PAS domain-containing sensor histidine kinase [Spirochaetaceae bacterium]|nr:PAS domain-containing sensor histidine kinase [Spirochaetaceae bacterium]
MNSRLQQAERTARSFGVILNALSEGVLIVDEQLIVQSVNRKAGQLFGVGEAGGKGFSLLEGTHSTELESLARRSLAENRPAEQEVRLYTAGEQRYFQVSVTPLPQREGLGIVLTEFTRLHKLEQVRKDFAANVSHELRTPIQLIKGFAETLLDAPPDDPEQLRHYIGIILKNAQTMEHLTADMLSLVTLEEGEDFSGAMLETSVYPLLQDAAASVEPAARRKNIAISVNCPAELKAVLYGPLIVQGVINLLDNAVKYSPPESEVQLTAEAQNGELTISVRDRGIGISAKHLPRIFERFYRADKSRSRSLGGAGLGLAIVRHIAAVHKGTATAESHAGEGSVFKIRIPQSLFF